MKRTAIISQIEDRPRDPRQMSRSAFARPTAIRGGLNTIQQGVTAERYVYSESELRAAISEVAVRFTVDDNGYFATGGGSIVIAGSFSVSSPIVIPPQAVFLSIVGACGARIIPTSQDQGALFTVQSTYVTISDLTAFYGVGLAYFTSFVEVEYLANAYNIKPNGCWVLRNKAWVERFYVDETASSDSNDAIVADNFMVDVNLTTDPAIVFSSKGCVCRGNDLDGASDVITLATGSEHCRISENNCNYADITSSASDGYNVIMGNVRTGTITSHATDAVGLNV